MQKKFCKMLASSFILFILVPSARSMPEIAVRFDGVYQTYFGGGNQSIYLRFYPDNYVVAFSFAGSPTEVASLISRRYPELPQGQYQLDHSKITFTTEAAKGEIDYEGIIHGDKIVFHIHSRITGFSSELKFTFYEVKFR